MCVRAGRTCGIVFGRLGDPLSLMYSGSLAFHGTRGMSSTVWMEYGLEWVYQSVKESVAL